MCSNPEPNRTGRGDNIPHGPWRTLRIFPYLPLLFIIGLPNQRKLSVVTQPPLSIIILSDPVPRFCLNFWCTLQVSFKSQVLFVDLLWRCRLGVLSTTYETSSHVFYFFETHRPTRTSLHLLKNTGLTVLFHSPCQLMLGCDLNEFGPRIHFTASFSTPSTGS